MKKLLQESPLFALTLGLCSSLAVTTTLENAYIMGLSITLILVLSNFIISLLKNAIPNNVQIPSYILIISTLVTILDVFLKNNLPLVSNSLGIYIPLIIVNCLILGRALNFACQNKVTNSIADGFKTGISYTLSLILIAFFREVLGSATITIVDKLSILLNFKLVIKLPSLLIFKNAIFTSGAGAFLTLGLILAFLKRGENNESH